MSKPAPTPAVPPLPREAQEVLDACRVAHRLVARPLTKEDAEYEQQIYEAIGKEVEAYFQTPTKHTNEGLVEHLMASEQTKQFFPDGALRDGAKEFLKEALAQDFKKHEMANSASGRKLALNLLKIAAAVAFIAAIAVGIAYAGMGITGAAAIGVAVMSVASEAIASVFKTMAMQIGAAVATPAKELVGGVLARRQGHGGTERLSERAKAAATRAALAMRGAAAAKSSPASPVAARAASPSQNRTASRT